MASTHYRNSISIHHRRLFPGESALAPVRFAEARHFPHGQPQYGGALRDIRRRNNTYTITAGGKDIWDLSDGFCFIYLEVPPGLEGLELRARIDPSPIPEPGGAASAAAIAVRRAKARRSVALPADSSCRKMFAEIPPEVVALARIRAVPPFLVESRARLLDEFQVLERFIEVACAEGGFGAGNHDEPGDGIRNHPRVDYPAISLPFAIFRGTPRRHHPRADVVSYSLPLIPAIQDSIGSLDKLIEIRNIARSLIHLDVRHHAVALPPGELTLVVGERFVIELWESGVERIESPFPFEEVSAAADVLPETFPGPCGGGAFPFCCASGCRKCQKQNASKGHRSWVRHGAFLRRDHFGAPMLAVTPRSDTKASRFGPHCRATIRIALAANRLGLIEEKTTDEAGVVGAAYLAAEWVGSFEDDPPLIADCADSVADGGIIDFPLSEKSAVLEVELAYTVAKPADFLRDVVTVEGGVGDIVENLGRRRLDFVQNADVVFRGQGVFDAEDDARFFRFRGKGLENFSGPILLLLGFERAASEEGEQNDFCVELGRSLDRVGNPPRRAALGNQRVAVQEYHADGRDDDAGFSIASL